MSQVGEGKLYDDAKFQALLLKVSHCHREHTPTLDEIKVLLTDALDEARGYIGTKGEVHALEVLLDRLEQGDEYMAISHMAHIFWWYFLNPGQAAEASVNADRPRPSAN